MFDLLKSLDAEIKKNKLGGSLPPPYVTSSGFDVIDIMNGTRDPETGKILAGFAESKIVGIIGKSGSGKTGLAIQISNNICHDEFGHLIPNSSLFHIDAEGSTERARIKTLTRKNQEQLDKYYRLINDNNVNTENLMKMVDVICTAKEENRKDLEMEIVDRNGDKYKILPPTVILIDSIAALNTTAENEDDTLGSNMLAAQNAKANASFIRKASIRIRGLNVHIIYINHIQTKIKTSMFPESAAINFLKQDETLPGGAAVPYYTDFLLKVEGGKKLDVDSDYGIKGFMVKATVVKSRTAPAGVCYELVYNQAQGFNNHLTNYVLLKENDAIEGARSYNVKGGTEKFTAKTLDALMNTNTELFNQFYDCVNEIIENKLVNIDLEEVEKSVNKFNELLEASVKEQD